MLLDQHGTQARYGGRHRLSGQVLGLMSPCGAARGGGVQFAVILVCFRLCLRACANKQLAQQAMPAWCCCLLMGCGAAVACAVLLQAVPQEIADVGAFLKKVLPPKN